MSEPRRESELHTDDLARSLRYVWKGPDTYTAGWDWTFPQWGVSVATFAALWLVTGFLALPVFTFTTLTGIVAIVFACLAFAVLAFYVAGPVTSRAMAPDTGLRYHLATLRAETTARRGPAGAVARARVIPALSPRKSHR